MDKACDFLLGAADPEVAGRLKTLSGDPSVLDRRFTQEEEFFLHLDQPFVVEPFEIHHDPLDPVPAPRYLSVIRSLVESWSAQVPGVFQGLSWFFTPQDLFHPVFVQVLSARGMRHLSVLRADLTFRGRYAEVLDRGTNDRTPRYSTQSLFVDAEVFPLDEVRTEGPFRKVFLSKLFSSTWTGETGDGYQRTGQWIDQEVTRLLSRAALAPGTRAFPHYPLRCTRGTLAVRTATPTAEGRRRAAFVLETAWPLVTPWADRILTGLGAEPFHEDHPLVAELRSAWAGRLEGQWPGFRLMASLNSHDQKEYRYHGD